MLKRIFIGIIVLIVMLGAFRFWVVQRTLTNMQTDTMGAFIGPVDAKNVIVEFMDYRCSYCRGFHADLQAFAKSNPDVKIVFRHFPLFMEPSIMESQMALAAANQGKFKAMHDILIAREEPVAEGEISTIAQQAGVDPIKLQQDMKSRDVAFHLAKTMDATDILGIDRAPSFMFNRGVFVPMNGVPDLAGFQAMYDQYKKK